MARTAFFSFHHENDGHRALQVRNIKTIEGNQPVPSNDWAQIKKQGPDAVRDWIDKEMLDKPCLILLVGSATAGRPWIDYEIEKAWREKKGVVGIRIHKLKNFRGFTDARGPDPFARFTVESGRKMSSIVRLYDPPGSESTRAYAWIVNNIEAAVVEAIKIRNGV